MADPLIEAEAELERASDAAGGRLREQLHAIDEGVFEEVGGERTQDDPGPKADRIAELADKLGGLAEEAEEPARSHVERAREHLLASQKERGT